MTNTGTATLLTAVTLIVGLTARPTPRPSARCTDSWTPRRNASPTAEPVSAQCLHAGVLDEVLISVTPLLLGEDPRQRAARASA